MVTSSKTAVTSQAKPKSVSAGKDAIALLKADHQAVSEMFAEYEKQTNKAKKKALASEICLALSVHAQIEEEIFYPAVKAALKDKLLVPEASVEHDGIKRLVSEIEDVEPDSEMFDAKVKVLSEYVKHHVKEEQNEMFPQARESSLDMDDLGEKLAARKEELLAAVS
jgi:hemerythrin superfamily protein